MIRKTLADDCFVTDKPRLTHREAIDILASRSVPITGVETVPLAAASGRILAEPARASRAVPLATNSAVDGYAFAAADLEAAAGAPLSIAGRAAAGHPFKGGRVSGAAIQIFTGAVLPEGLDTVAMQEDVTVEAGPPLRVVVPPGLKRGANVRKAGEDVPEGATLIEAGAVLRAQDLAGLASIGYGEVAVRCHLRVAIVSSGDEVVRAGSRALGPGEVYDANAPMLAALIASAGAEAEDLGVWPDRREEVERRLADAARRFDVILTTGGASKGAEDHMAAALDALGRRHLWQLAVKPGRPMMFGQIRSAPERAQGDGARDTVMIGLPGNPVAVFVCFLMYAYPLIRRLAGAPWPEPVRYPLPAAFDFTGRKPGRREFWRAMLVQGPDGALAADKFARDGSGLISGLRAADGLIDIPEDHGDVRRGDIVHFIPFSEFGIVGR